MKIKTQKGITIIALVISIILMLILVAVGIEFGGDALKEAKLEDIKTDMISIKTIMLMVGYMEIIELTFNILEIIPFFMHII